MTRKHTYRPAFDGWEQEDKMVKNGVLKGQYQLLFISSEPLIMNLQ